MSEKRKKPGEEFEAAFRRSVPDGVYVRRLRTPTAMGSVVPRLLGLIRDLCSTLGRPVPEWVEKAGRFRFTPKAGYDFLLTVPAPGDTWAVGDFLPVEVVPSFVLALELKSVAGKSLSHSNVDADQERALREASAAGHLACLVVEFRAVSEIWVIPVQAWIQARAASDRASLPLSTAREIGMRIFPDPDRGITLPYLDVAEWLESWGAVLPERSLRRAPAESMTTFPEEE